MDEQASTASTAPDGRSRFPRSVVLAAAGLVVLVVVALGLALALPDRPAEYPEGSPEAAFQDYFEAWEARDYAAAHALLAADLRSDISVDEYRRMDADMRWIREQDRRVVLLEANVTGDRALLDLRIDQFSEGGLGGNRYSYQQTVPMVREDGAWYVDQALLGVEQAPYPGEY